MSFEKHWANPKTDLVDPHQTKNGQNARSCSLHAGLEAAWTDLDANTMRNFCSQFTKRLEAVVKAN